MEFQFGLKILNLALARVSALTFEYFLEKIESADFQPLTRD